MTNKDIDNRIHRLLGLETKYSIVADSTVLDSGLSLKEANHFIKDENKEFTFRPGYSPMLVITSDRPISYSVNLEYAMSAAKQLCNGKGFTFVLTYNAKEQWRAAFGDYKNCEEVEDSDPAKATCLSIIKFMERL